MKFFDPFWSPVQSIADITTATTMEQPKRSYKTEQPQRSLRRVREEPQKNQQPADVEPFPSSPELRKPPKQKSPVNPGQGVFQTLTYILYSTLILCVCFCSTGSSDHRLKSNLATLNSCIHTFTHSLHKDIINNQNSQAICSVWCS